MEHVLLATNHRDIGHHRALAEAHRVGMEIQVYGYEPDLLDGGWREVLSQHKGALRGFEGDLAIHGAFYDLAPGSIDRRASALARERYILNLEIAVELGARHVVFHTDFIPIVPSPSYRAGWMEREAAFWSRLVEEAVRRDVTIVLENMWDPAPDIVGDLLDRVDSPHLCACLDVAHFYLYARDVSLQDWIARIAPRLVHCHMNNHRGRYDEHLPLDLAGGVIDYWQDVLPLLAQVPAPLWLVLEMNRLEYLQRSLRYLGL
jgi:sugar phosphate isomerase/epimerase